MLYLNDAHLLKLGINWSHLVKEVRSTARLLQEKDFSQPIKPYLRYKDLKNRIIAMPAYIGGGNPGAGIKWIASFPDNIAKGIPRAHAVTILNDVYTGQPLATFNSGLLSQIRTASVTGLVVEEFMSAQPHRKGLTVGINGFGPIGRTHLQMFESLFGDRIDKYLVYDLQQSKTAQLPGYLQDKIRVMDSWHAVYEPSAIFVTCTVSKERYVNIPPPKGSLQLNISLRDYMPEYRQYVDLMIVDDWEEVCRENTDIEQMYRHSGLQQADTISLGELICDKKLYETAQDAVIMFNPMGMAVFDITVARYFYQLASEEQAGVVLED